MQNLGLAAWSYQNVASSLTTRTNIEGPTMPVNCQPTAANRTGRPAYLKAVGHPEGGTGAASAMQIKPPPLPWPPPPLRT